MVTLQDFVYLHLFIDNPILELVGEPQIGRAHV